MATSRRKRSNNIINLLGDVLDDTKDLVDDAVDRAKDFEHDARRTARRVVGPDDEVESLKAAIDDLAAKVSRLADLQAEPGKKRP